jgi:hypothetical protein
MTRPITEWVKILDPMTAEQAAAHIIVRMDMELSDTGVRDDTLMLANALTAWAMLAKGEEP